MIPVITIDGPSGSGKGTISQIVARRLGWHFLDSGALYRLTALAARRAGVALDDETRLAQLARGLDVRFDAAQDSTAESKIFLGADDVTAALRSEECGNAASKVAALPALRAALLERQRAFRRPPGLVADGRDMGSVIFPDAALKIFLTASPEVRARRRHKQLKEKGMDVNIIDLISDIAERDARDSTRSVAPLKPAPDAVVIDTSDLSIEDVAQRVLRLWREASSARSL
ncbi:MAG: (d)CMP kinase [Pseudomonadota bacterium]